MRWRARWKISVKVTNSKSCMRARSFSAGVVHADADLHSTHRRVSKERGHFDQGVGRQPAVGVEYRHDHVVGIPVTQDPRVAEIAVGGVQGLTLALPGVRQGALEKPDALGIQLSNHVRGAVLGGVVDDHDLEVAGNGQQPLEAPADHSLLVEARNEEDEQQVVGCRKLRIPILAGQQQQPDAVQGRENDEGEGDPGDHVSPGPTRWREGEARHSNSDRRHR